MRGGQEWNSRGERRTRISYSIDEQKDDRIGQKEVGSKRWDDRRTRIHRGDKRTGMRCGGGGTD